LTVFGRSRYDRTVQICRLLALVVVLGAVGTASPAYALDESAARQHFEKATEAFTRGRYDDAVREYLLAYRASNDSSLLFNVAQSHRLAGHYSSALQYYRMYLQNTPDAQDRKEVERQIKEMEKKLGGDQSTAPSKLPPPEKLAPPPLKPVPPPAELPVTPPPTTVTPPPATPDTGPHTTVESPFAGRMKIIAGGVTLGVGVALVATGIAFGALAQKAGDDLTAANHAGLPFDPNKQSEGKTDTIVEGVTLGIGAAAAIAGAVVLGLGITEKRAARVAVVPVISPTGAAASMSVRF
jgi:hypothetical protein